MKNVIFSALATLFFLGVNAQAESLTIDQANQKVMNSLEEEGYLDDLSSSELKTVETMVFDSVTHEFNNTDGLNLSEAAVQAAILDKLKDLGGKIVSGAKSLATKIKDLGKSIASKVGPFVVKHKAQLVALAKKAHPIVLPKLKEAVAKLGAKGLDLAVAKGIMGSMTPEKQKELAAKGADKIAEALAAYVKKHATSTKLATK